MVSTLAELKKQRQNSFTNLTKKVEEYSKNAQGGQADDRYWTPEVDKVGNGYAIIRFLPAKQGEELPWVRMWNHGFQGPGGWYIENSLTTIGKQDPVSELNSKLWKSGNEKDKEIVRKQKRRLSYYANILVVKDPAHPENEGKVFIFKFGKKIFDKIEALMKPEFEDEQPVNPFDFWDGCNFKLKIRKVEGYRNYDKSEFEKPSPVSDNDKEIESIWKRQYSLADIVSPDKFKSYDELKARLDRVLNGGDSSKEDIVKEDTMTDSDFEKPRAVAAPRGKTAQPSAEDMEFFKTLAAGDGDDDSLPWKE